MPDTSTVWGIQMPSAFKPGLTTKIIVRQGNIVVPNVTAFPINIHLVALGSGVSGFFGY